jgi:glycerol 2-dehydrogenase (NADP+)
MDFSIFQEDHTMTINLADGNGTPLNPDGTVRTTDEVNFNQSWAEIEKLLDTGKVRSIGVSNFSIKT